MSSAAWRLALLAVAVAGSLAGPGADRADAAGCQGDDGVTVVVDFGSLGGGVVVRCAPGDPASGLAALQATGFSYSFVPRFPGLVCQIDATPNPCNGAPDEAYWAYFHAPAGGSWDYSDEGAGTYDPAPGTVEGWAFDDDPGGLRSPPSPAPAPPPPPPPPSTTGVAPVPTTPPTATSGGQATNPPPGETDPGGATGATTTTAAATAVPGESTTTTSASSTTTARRDLGSGAEEDAAAPVAVGNQSSGGGLAATAAGIGVVGAVAAGGAVVARRRRLASLDGATDP